MEQFEQVKLANIQPNKVNFRKRFEGPDFDDLVTSVAKHGVIQPIVVRPAGKKKEIVCGERRFRAAKIASKKKGGVKTIPAVVRELSDDEMFDLMVIENLMREDLTELEEAQGFKAYLDKRGDEAVVDLAERSGINAAYIRRRVAVLGLPAPVLDAWGDGDIAYGYLEQLTRLDDENEILGFFEDVVDGWQISSIKDLKRVIDNRAIGLDHAVFDLKAVGCVACAANSDTQIQLFAVDATAGRCLKPSCFLDKQKAWLDANWKGSPYFKEHKTCGYRFADEVEADRRYYFHRKGDVGKDCFKCEALVTLFGGPKLDVRFERVCVGEKSCFVKLFATEKDTEVVKEGRDDQPRVSWHGEHFRETFFKEQIPLRFEQLADRGLASVQLSLFALIKSSHKLAVWFRDTYSDEQSEEDVWYSVGDADIFELISCMDVKKASAALKQATLQVIIEDDFLAAGRRIVAGHIGIDLTSQWILTEDYLKKKTISEMLGMGERFGIFADPKAKQYLAETIQKKAFVQCKKVELIDVFLKSGVDLSGKVPDEILSS